MKTKKATLGFLAAIMAIGIAFANPAPSQNAWIRISLLGSGLYNCVDSGFQCDDNGPTACKVDVLTIYGIVTVNGNRPMGCAMVLTHSTNTSTGLYIPSVGLIVGAN